MKGQMAVGGQLSAGAGLGNGSHCFDTLLAEHNLYDGGGTQRGIRQCPLQHDCPRRSTTDSVSR
jgi:hypothetical protein